MIIAETSISGVSSRFTFTTSRKCLIGNAVAGCLHYFVAEDYYRYDFHTKIAVTKLCAPDELETRESTNRIREIIDQSHTL